MTTLEIILLTLATAGTAVLALALTGLALAYRRRLRGSKPVANAVVVYVGTAGLAVLCLVAAAAIVEEGGPYLFPAAAFGYVALIELIFIINAGRVVDISAKRDRTRATLADLLPELDNAIRQPETGAARRLFIRLQRQLIRLNLRF